MVGFDAVDGKGDPVERCESRTVEPDCRLSRTRAARLCSNAVSGRLKTEGNEQDCTDASRIRKKAICGSVQRGHGAVLCGYSQKAWTIVLSSPSIKFRRFGLWVMPRMPRVGMIQRNILGRSS